jgi:hypothetical protein
LCLIQLFATNPRFKTFFSTPLQELPLVALYWQEKTSFKTAGFPLQSGAGFTLLLNIPFTSLRGVIFLQKKQYKMTLKKFDSKI